MTPLHIRDATPDDLQTIVAFNAALAEESEGKSLALDTLQPGVRAALENPVRGRYFLACHESRVIGQLMITTEWSDWRNGDIWWIQSVYVHPDHRRRGVFRALFAHVQHLARTSPDVVGLRLYVENNNTAAQHTYRNLGMRAAGYTVYEQIPLD